jgi:hypothetical protein
LKGDPFKKKTCDAASRNPSNTEPPSLTLFQARWDNPPSAVSETASLRSSPLKKTCEWVVKRREGEKGGAEDTYILYACEQYIYACTHTHTHIYIYIYIYIMDLCLNELGLL